MAEVNFAKIEKKWQNRWAKEKVFEADEESEKRKFYVLEMFPYPSGSGLHMGHAWNYTIGDILSRFKTMSGFEVLHPMGYDALGLPAENAAVKAKTHPEEYTKKSIANFTKQFKSLGISYDWSRVLNTADASYYKWDQWIFLKMMEKGLVYQKESAVNWCNRCHTVLANEQVHEGKCWRHEDTDVHVKHLKQWFLKTTEYAEELYANLENMDWPERTKAMQRNWIGKSNGVEIDFEIIPKGIAPENEKDNVWKIFTTRPDTIFGVTFMVVSAQHSRINELVSEKERDKVDKFLKKLKSVSEKELERLDKFGVFSGSNAINPATGEEIPVWIGNFVVADYGAGMVMAVPAHDQRDFEFAKKYKIEIKQVVSGKIDEKRAWTGEGKLMNSGKFTGTGNDKAKDAIADWLKGKKAARKVVNYKLRDWGISRQRYWGTPIPIIHCEKCGAVPVPESDLPVRLPKDVKFGKGNPLETNKKWLNVKCPKCKGAAQRESDTMDTFVNSSWYFLRYCDPSNDKNIFDPVKVRHWCPVDVYIGGAEHACMHLIYSRFYVKFLRDLGLIDFDEPAMRLFHQGMLHGENGVKMSKSKGNGVLPEVVSEKYGIDTARFFLSGIASPDKNIDWSEKGIAGSARFIRKVMGLFDKVGEAGVMLVDKDVLQVAPPVIEKGESEEESEEEGEEEEVINAKKKKFMAREKEVEFVISDSDEVLSLLNEAIGFVGEKIEAFDYRPATIKLKELFDLLAKQDCVTRDTLEKSLKLLAPFCPHVAEELWEKMGNESFVSLSEWPVVDERKILVEGGVVDLNQKIISDIKRILEKVGKDNKKVYVYVMPFELKDVRVSVISEDVGKEVKIFSVADSRKHDPEGKAKRAKPGKASIYLE